MSQVFKKIEPRIAELYRARRKDLEMTMHANDLTHEPGMAANTMRAILEDKGITKVVPYDAEQALEWERPKLRVVEDEPDGGGEPSQPAATDITEMRVPELATVMKRKGIPYKPGMKRMECLKLIWQHEATSGEDTS